MPAIDDRVKKQGSAPRLAINNKSLEELLYQGYQEQQGNLCLVYQSALFFIDFKSQKASYNRAGKQLLDSQSKLKVAQFNISQQTRTPYELPYQSTLFAFVWLLYQLLDQQGLIKPMQEQSAISVKQWPSFELVTHNFDDYRMASLLQKKALSAQQVIDLLSVPQEQVYRFFNTLILTHHANTENSQTLKFDHTKSGSTISKLWRKLRFSLNM